MALATEAALREMFIHGAGVLRWTESLLSHVPLSEFFHMPEPGERDPWPGIVYFPHEPYDDGGGAVVAAYRFGLCPTAK